MKGWKKSQSGSKIDPARRGYAHLSKRKKSLSSRKGLISILVVVLFLWWFLPEFQLISRYRLPPLFEVAAEFFGPAFIAQIGIAANEVLTGFVLGVSAGIAAGTLAAYSERAERAISPVAVFFSAIKKSTLAPIFVVWLGYGLTPLVLVAALICFFPAMVNTLDGLKLVEPNYVEMMNSIQASRWHTFKKLRFPNALPKIFDGLRISAPLAVIGAVVGEFLIGLRGVGVMLQMGVSLANSRIVFASIIWMAAMGMALYLLVVLVERLILPAPLRRRR